jgi:predicted signal transduction protein with EAL and GGDEF domain
LFLRAAGVHSMQGYRFGKPVTPDKTTERLRAARSAGAGRPKVLAGEGLFDPAHESPLPD